jgi:uncharacterized protein YrzB (UPF0473 family)
MNDKEIFDALLDEDNLDNIIMTDDEGNTFEMEQIGTIPMHGVIYGILDLIKINNTAVTEEEAGLVMLELDTDDEGTEFYVSTIEDDELFNEVIEAFNSLPEE